MPEPKKVEAPKPYANLIMIKEHEVAEYLTPGGLVVQASNKRNIFICTGQVLDVGPGFTTPVGQLVPPRVKPGEWVLYQRQATTEWKNIETGESFHFIPDGNIMAIIPAPVPVK